MNDTTRYSRTLWILICCYFTFGFSASLLLSLLPASHHSQPAKLLLSFFSIVSFLVPVLIVRKMFWLKDTNTDDGNRQPFNVWIILLAVSAMICAIVVMNWLGQLNHQIPLWSALKEAELKAHEKMQVYMKMDSIILLIYNLIIFAVIPAVCEEIFFRRTMQPLWVKIIGSNWQAVIITATIFSLFHFEFLGFLPRFFAGLVLGSVFVFSKSILLTIFCHFLYNGSIVTLNYIEQHSSFEPGVFQQHLLNPYLNISAFLLTGMLLLQFRKISIRRKEFA